MPFLSLHQHPPLRWIRALPSSVSAPADYVVVSSFCSFCCCRPVEEAWRAGGCQNLELEAARGLEVQMVEPFQTPIYSHACCALARLNGPGYRKS